MTRTEDNAWYLCAGILIGMVLAFWFAWDIDFYRVQWTVFMAMLIVWFVVRDFIMRRRKDDQSRMGTKPVK